MPIIWFILVGKLLALYGPLNGMLLQFNVLSSSFAGAVVVEVVVVGNGVVVVGTGVVVEVVLGTVIVSFIESCSVVSLVETCSSGLEESESLHSATFPSSSTTIPKFTLAPNCTPLGLGAA